MNGIFYLKADLDLADDTLAGRRTRQCVAARGQITEALRAVGLHITDTISSPTRGTFREVWYFRLASGQEITVRVADRDASAIGINGATEAMVLKALNGSPLQTPKVIAFLPEEPSRQALLVTSHIPGVALSSLDANEDDFMERVPALALSLRAVHKVRGSGYGLISGVHEAALHADSTSWANYILQNLNTHLDFLSNHQIIDTAAHQAIADIFNTHYQEFLIGESHLLHGDCGSHNVIITHNTSDLVLIDWEDSLLGDPLFDLAGWASFQPMRRWSSFFTAYFGSEWQPNRLFWIYYLRIAIAKMVHRIRFSYSDLPGRSPAAQRIHDALKAVSTCF